MSESIIMNSIFKIKSISFIGRDAIHNDIVISPYFLRF